MTVRNPIRWRAEIFGFMIVAQCLVEGGAGLRRGERAEKTLEPRVGVRRRGGRRWVGRSGACRTDVRALLQKPDELFTQPVVFRIFEQLLARARPRKRNLEDLTDRRG